MALIICPECKSEISDKANVCPKCGNPIAIDTVHETPVTVQRTKKGWKIVKLASVLLIVAGLYCLVTGAYGLAITFVFFGFLVGIISGIGSWWSTG